MATNNHFINFNLRNKKADISTIQLIVRWRSNRFVGNAQHRIDPNHWDIKGQKAKTGLANLTSEKRKVYRAMNDDLQSHRDIVDDIFVTYNDQNGTTPELSIFKQLYHKRIEIKSADYQAAKKMTLFDFIDNVMPHKTFSTKQGPKKVTPQTVRNYKQTGRLLSRFADEKRYNVDFDTINMDFLCCGC